MILRKINKATQNANKKLSNLYRFNDLYSKLLSSYVIISISMIDSKYLNNTNISNYHKNFRPPIYHNPERFQYKS